MEVNTGSRYYRDFIKYFKKTKKNPSGKCVYVTKSLLMKIFLCEKLDGLIYLKNLKLTERETEIFHSFNAKRIFRDSNKEYYIDESISKIIIQFYDKYMSHNNNFVSSNQSRDRKYTNATEIDDNLIEPDEDHSYDDVILNLFYNVDIDYSFIDIETTSLVLSSQLQCCEFNVNNTGHFKVIPSKFTCTCTEQIDGGECGNIVSYCKIHDQSKIKCNHDSGAVGAAHQIKNPFGKPPVENRKLYHYILSDRFNENPDEKNKDINAYSLIKIVDNNIKCNCMYVNDEKEPFVLILSIKKHYDYEEFNDSILLKDPKHATMLTDVYESIKNYYSKYHNKKISSKNKIIWEIIILQMLCKKFFNHRFHSIFLGESGAGKTFPVDALLPLFTFNEQRIIGSSITPNKFLGGPQTKGVSTFIPGYASSQDAVFLDEITSSIQKFIKNPDEISNPFNMAKDAAKDFYKRSIQGAEKVPGNAVFILAGNIENMKEHITEYKKRVRRKYTNYTGGSSKHFKTLFRSVNYYNLDTGDKNLALAHAFVRNNYYYKRDYLTGLEDAERARFPIIVMLENIDNKFKKLEYGSNYQNKNIYKQFDTISGLRVHRKNFTEELTMEIGEPKIPQSFCNEVCDLFNDYLKSDDNNFRVGSRKVNAHVQAGLLNLITDWLFMEKLYWKRDLKVDKEKDLIIINSVLQYINNSLDDNEAAKFKRPHFNNFSSIKGETANDGLFDFNEKNNDEIRLKIEDRKKELINQVNPRL